MAPPLGLVLGLALAVAGSGCTAAATRSGRPTTRTIKTVYVPVFRSVTFRRDVNFMLTEPVIKEIERRTPYKVVGNARGGRHDARRDGQLLRQERDRREPVQPASPAHHDDDGRPPPGPTTGPRRRSPNPAVVAEIFNFYPELGETAQAALLPDLREAGASEIVGMMERRPGEGPDPLIREADMSRWEPAGRVVADGRAPRGDGDRQRHARQLLRRRPSLALDDAVAIAERLVAEGADLLDIGGESSRPGRRGRPGRGGDRAG